MLQAASTKSNLKTLQDLQDVPTSSTDQISQSIPNQTQINQLSPDQSTHINRKRKQEDPKENKTEENRESTPSPSSIISKRQRKPNLEKSGSTSSSSPAESRSSTPESEYELMSDNDPMFDDLDDDIPLLTISPKKPKNVAPSLPK